MPSVSYLQTGEVTKVTKLEKKTIDDYNNNELLKTLLGSQFGAPTIGVGAALLLGPLVAAFILKETGETVKESKWQDFLFGETGISENLVKRFFNISGDII
jgi:hypothetical protein